MRNGEGKKVLTTGDVARICNVAPRTVSKWFDSGQLRGYRIPGSKDRRIPIEQLVRFMKAHGMPTTGLDIGLAKVVVVDSDRELIDILTQTLGANEQFEVLAAASLFEAGLIVEQARPSAVIVDTTLCSVDPVELCRALRVRDHLADIKLIATGEAMTEGQGQALIQQGFAGYLSKPFDIHDLRESLQSLIR